MNVLADQYRRRLDTVLIRIAGALEQHIRELVEREPRVDRVTARAKSVDRFLAKAEAFAGNEKKYSEPSKQIQDQLGARIITFYRSDVDRIERTILKYFRPIESKELNPESEWGIRVFRTALHSECPVGRDRRVDGQGPCASGF